ncbi:MAG: L-threonylcarbamoyladenylate synthase, partial [Verrucomicrobiota bacterium]
MKTEISTDPHRAVELLRKGEIVALPTETVYGLAADAFNAIAVAKIFEAKERPRFDPLIVHISDFEWFERIVDLSTQDRQLLLALTDRFWPGPFTLVLPKQATVPDIVTAGLPTVAVRMSGHPLLMEIVRAIGPLAAPSANRFGRISPTITQHVLDELGSRIPLVLDGGPAEHGIESTIVRVSSGKIDILRRGPITEQQLAKFGQIRVVTGEKVSAPGQLPSHYAPNKPLMLIDNPADFANDRAGLLAWNSVEGKNFAAIRQLSARHDLREAAANLFRYLRELDANEDVDLIVAERVPHHGLGAAIMDRLTR